MNGFQDSICAGGIAVGEINRMTLEWTRGTAVKSAGSRAGSRTPGSTAQETRMKHFVLPALLALGGCSSLHLPDTPVMITSDFQPAIESLVVAAAIGAVAYYVIDPMAPNWEVRTARLDTTRIEISLRKKRFSTGGDGEAINLFKRRAGELATRSGSAGYVLISYTEGIDSETVTARRIARGVVQLLPPA
jgi:hypothetical protein